MELQDQITADLKQAMLDQNSLRVSVLRMLKSELKNAEIAHGATLTEEQVLQTIKREAKKRRDAVEAFTAASQTERAQAEEEEFTILNHYLPAQVDTETLTAFISAEVTRLSEPSAKSRGEVIKKTIAHFGSSADGKAISQIVSSLLP